ncbi:hypothetical protein HMPREF0742_02156 [Rothia aeria F0184]|uniref:Uncharacterized protein n=1 Tax=Rothia aeria F0184 TaxID=888019 RepID=U7UZT2_9MICC|nr:hypothetical protein HMPREF0742_02156 [Rothia aeria F0184]
MRCVVVCFSPSTFDTTLLGRVLSVIGVFWLVEYLCGASRAENMLCGDVRSRCGFVPAEYRITTQILISTAYPNN